MYSDNIRQTSDYFEDSDLLADNIIFSLLIFLEINLSEFPEKINIKPDTNEEIINQKLLRFLNSKNKLFSFVPENRDETGKDKRKPDFGVYEKIEIYDDNQKRFFDIECKRLYHPSKSKQYVSGKTGGIQRFKDNKHGVDLSYSAMVGYVETEDFSFWQKKVNSWISDKDEYLEMLEIKQIAKLKSTHKKITKETIELTHFWLKMDFRDN